VLGLIAYHVDDRNVVGEPPSNCAELQRLAVYLKKQHTG